MSPEQARAKELDARSDLFSFGTVLYEMATGRLAFPGESTALIFKAILDEAPCLPLRLNPQLPAALEPILSKAMEKDRNLRYQSAADLRADLARLKRDLDSGRSGSVATVLGAAASPTGLAGPATSAEGARSASSVPPAAAASGSAPSPGGSRKYLVAGGAALVLLAVAAGIFVARNRGDRGKISSIAVLPFVNATSDPNNEYLSDGLTESLIGTLSQLPDTKVMARTTVFRFKGKEDDPQKIGQALQVNALLTGRLTQRGDTIAVQADLVNTADGSELWGSRYERKLSELTQVQHDITRDLSERLQVKRTGAEQQTLGSAGTKNAEAYQLYLEGRQEMYRRSPESIRKSIDLFERAVKADPNYALANGPLGSEQHCDGLWRGGAAGAGLCSGRRGVAESLGVGRQVVRGAHRPRTGALQPGEVGRLRERVSARFGAQSERSFRPLFLWLHLFDAAKAH